MTTTTPPLIITRIFDAPREKVFDAWAKPELAMQWWGPKGFTTPVCKIDFRVGGIYHNCMQSAEGKNYWSTGVYRDIVKPKRIICTDSFADPAGNVVPASYYGMTEDFPTELLITVTFEELDDKTKFTLQHEGFPPGEMYRSATTGWNECFDKLAEMLK